MTPTPTHALRTADLLARYERPGPRYTSYPTAVEFHPGVDDAVYRRHLAEADRHASRPLSLYVHLPFCEERCAFCGCNVIITKHREVAAGYLDHLGRELDLLAASLPHRRTLSQMHWGGGTPTYYTVAELTRLFEHVARHFAFTPSAEIGIEIDPRVTSHEQLRALRSLGFTRLSMGVQDFAADVQQAVNRIQSLALTRERIEQARALGFASVNVDLIYGLPHQRREGFAETLAQVLTLRPDRVAVYSFAYVPWMRAHMKRLDHEAMPSPQAKLELLALAIESFTGAGYVQIGIDHFARPDDELARAVATRAVHRNFMGYTVQHTADLVAAGVSGIGDVQGAFVQNVKKLPDYYAALAEGRFPIERGYELTADDLVRRHVIHALMCDCRLVFGEVERRFGIDVPQYFAAELLALTAEHSPLTDGLVEVTADALEVTAVGRMFVRNICMVFDRYLDDRNRAGAPVFSRTI